MSGTWQLAVAGLRARRGRSLLTAFGIFATSLTLGVALTVAAGLATGFDRAANRADLPTVAVRFADASRATIDARVRALPGLQARAYRTEFTRARLFGPGRRFLDRGVLEIVDDHARRGYAIVAGRDVRAAGDEVVIERGLADAWHLHVGQRLGFGRLGPQRIVGIALAPDNVAYPLTSTARVYLSREALQRRFGGDVLPVNVALLWATPGARQDVLLAQARVSAFGVRDLSFVTREGVRVILSQAAGIVTALIAAFALVAAALAGVLLGAGAQSEVLRRLPAIGVQRAVGMTPGAVARLYAAEALLVAAPSAFAGLLAGGVLAHGPTGRLLGLLNELAPGVGAQALLLGATWIVVVALVTAGVVVPAARAARRPPAQLLRGGAGLGSGASGLRGAHTGLGLLGARLVAARRARFAAIVGVLGAAAAVVLLLIGLAGLLQRLRSDPATLGKRYQLSVRAPADTAPSIAAIPGVVGAAPRYSVDAANSFDLGSPVRLVAYPGDHTRFEAPPLASGRRAAGDGEAEIGQGLADAQGLSVGSTLAAQLPGGAEVRFHVTGIVRALEDQGRVAYVRSGPLLRAQPDLSGLIAVRVAEGANRTRISDAITAISGIPVRTVGGATGGSSRALVSVLAGVLRLLAITVALVCLYALTQTLTLTARERRRAIATLRASGASAPALRRLLFGAAAAVCVPAALVGLAIEALVLSPGVSRLTAGYADLSPAPSAGQVVLAWAGLALGAAAVAGWTARLLLREPVVAGLREESA